MTAITAATAAERLGVTVRRVQALITAHRLPATPFGKAWLIEESDLALVAVRKPGRPKRLHDAAPSHAGRRSG
jgi:excisionase family DNA binding protein